MHESSDSAAGSLALGVLAGVLWLTWQATRALLLALLKILEPVICTMLAAAALLGTLTAFIWKLASNRPHVPFFGVLALSVACFLLMTLYHGAIRLVSGISSGRCV